MDIQRMPMKDVIEFALDREVMSRRLYEHLASRTKQDDARMMLLELVSFEAEHVRIFTRALKGEIDRLRFNILAYLEAVECRPFSMPGLLTEAVLKTGTMKEILPAAKKFEKTMSEFYAKVAEQSQEKPVQEAARRLSKEEMGHFEYVVRVGEVLGLSLDLDDGEFHAQ
jgi:rubrerythrin